MYRYASALDGHCDIATLSSCSIYLVVYLWFSHSRKHSANHFTLLDLVLQYYNS